ncbi:MAG: SH3 domain-containing protein [Treponema sp.]|jgi:hypothetical protein|nr:SH3 domain-containing protein [Treponema sp.]
MILKRDVTLLLYLTLILSFSSCSRLGWGVLLWSTEEPTIPSGTVLPVYIRSNIDQVWVVGVPEQFRKERKETQKMEIPLSRFIFSGSRKKAAQKAREFEEYAPLYAENLQDGLPIRDNPENNSRRVYRLRTGEIIKILDEVKGSPAISASGEPLPGAWYRVLTHDGVSGYCFSYRLRIFDQSEGYLLGDAPAQKSISITPDPDFDMVMSKIWSSESYLQMVNSKRIDIPELERHWRFDPGQDTGIARIILPDIEREFIYDGIYPDGERAWRFEGSSLKMNLRNNNTLAVQFNDNTTRTIVFVSLSSDVDDLILQETTRRENQYLSIYEQGPVFTSNNYGTITFTPAGDFLWTGFDLLVPQLIHGNASGNGQVFMDLFLTPSFEERYNGAFTFSFNEVPVSSGRVRFMYNLDNHGLRLEVAPEYAVEGVTITRRSSSPMVMYFFRDM